MMYNIKSSYKNQVQVNNQEYILNQMEDRAELKREFDFREKLYYKPHFGPEETDSQIEAENNRRNMQKMYINNSLALQIDFE